MGKFTVEENNFICVFDKKNRRELIEDIEHILPHLKESDMLEIATNVMLKVLNMTDDEFNKISLVEAD